MKHRLEVQMRARGGGVSHAMKSMEPHNPPISGQDNEKNYGGGKSKVNTAAQERKRGGRVERAAGGAVGGAKVATRMDRPGRKRGGGVGSDTSPLTSASRSSPQKLAEQH